MESPAYRVRRSPRARRVRIVVDHRGVEVVAPAAASEAEIERFVRRNCAWVERSLQRFLRPEPCEVAVQLADGGHIPYLGAALTLYVSHEPGRAHSVVRSSQHALEVATARADEAGLRETLERWYRNRARAEVAARLDLACDRAGRQYERLSIRGQRTRWASCSPSGTMSFNWRLLLAPERILDYVVEHEVCHLDVADHSHRFYNLLEQRLPDYRERERWLRNFGHALWL